MRDLMHACSFIFQISALTLLFVFILFCFALFRSVFVLSLFIYLVSLLFLVFFNAVLFF